jgi:hypothetical protein
MAEFYAIPVDMWRGFLQGLTTGPESARLLKWSAALKAFGSACSPEPLSLWGSIRPSDPLLTEDERALLSPHILPNLGDPRLHQAWRRVFLATARHRLSTREPRLSATLGITIPDAKLFRDDSDRTQWQLVVDTWVYPKTVPPGDLAFLVDEDAYCGLASPDVVSDILKRDQATGLFRRVAAYYCGEGGEFTAIHRFLELACVQKLSVYFNDTAT